MPKLDESVAVAEVRAVKPSQTVLFITGYKDEDIPLDILTASASKPFNIVGLSYPSDKFLYPKV